ncbi:hypothetical protein GCM10009798_32620 [Nocardioides panacihumi]|uniref:Uncharacterized protein n=1 Tax=Nocardioides panacihumi TaxID=400774 RepID=A0ABN2RIF4_9ACTN
MSAPTAETGALTRSDVMSAVDVTVRGEVERLTALAVAGLPHAYYPATGEFAQTVRGVTRPDGVALQREGVNLRYAAMAALGLARTSDEAQRSVLAGRTAGEIVRLAAERAETSADPGAVALAVWAVAEVENDSVDTLVARLRGFLDGRALPTVDAAWILTAAVAASSYADTSDVVASATRLLASHAGRSGLFPHTLPASAQARWRAHVGSFADQVYPLQAFARASVLTGDRSLLERANTIARRLCDVQGAAGQWWWHYDSRDGSVVEAFPVYSVHQHAMAPMVLFDLWEAGGDDHRARIARGLGWLNRHPEVVDELVSERHHLVWRKVGRREPPKAARAIGALSTSLKQGLHVPGLDRLMPAGVVDRECRPYELGWLLYAWLSPAKAAADD